MSLLLDYASAGQGSLDEVRLDGGAVLATSLFPLEPGTGGLLYTGLLAVSVQGRLRPRSTAAYIEK